MRELEGRLALITGASRGLGAALAEGLGAAGMRLLLAARSGDQLEAVAEGLRAKGVEVRVALCDVADLGALQALAEIGEGELGGVDLLVNNAGIESMGSYEQLELESIARMCDVNLRAPMWLTRAVLPGMLARGRGHVLNVASLAGLAATAYGEPYAATKHGVVGFTRSLRATARARGWPVSASALCPGYVEEIGMYADMERDYGAKAKGAIGTVTPGRVVAAALRGIRKDLPDIIVAPGPMRGMLALNMLMPRFGEWASNKLGAHRVFEKVADAKQGRDS